MFITFEGIDYSGKTTQAKLLVECLTRNGHDVVFLREPGGTSISEKIRLILLDREHETLTQRSELLLFSAARTQLVSEVIHPALTSGKIVVCDRFYDSTTAYQGYGRGLALEDVTHLNSFAVNGTRPTLTVLVDVEVGEISRRQRAAGLSADRMESAGSRFFERVRQGYLAIARAEPDRVVVFNGAQPVDTIRDEIWKLVQSRLP